MKRCTHSSRLYLAMLHALKHLGDAEKLSQSDLLSSCLVAQQCSDNPTLAEQEALRQVLADLVKLLETGYPSYAQLLYLRFWDGLTLDEVRELEPFAHLSIRAIQHQQKIAIGQVSAWFVVREHACQQRLEQGEHNTLFRLQLLGAVLGLALLLLWLVGRHSIRVTITKIYT